MSKRDKPKITEVLFLEDHMKVRWICKHCGFGELDIYSNTDNKYDVYTECMGQQFYEEILVDLQRFLLKESHIKE